MFQEYPKWIYPEQSDPVLVRSAEAEAQVLGEPFSAAPKLEPELLKRGPGRPRKGAS